MRLRLASGGMHPGVTLVRAHIRMVISERLRTCILLSPTIPRPFFPLPVLGVEV